jgi:hypothetical protein
MLTSPTAAQSRQVANEIVAYDGTIQEGKFIVCTSRFSAPGVYVYGVEVIAALPSDSYTQTVIQVNGQCTVAFATPRRGGPSPVIRVHADPFHTLAASDLWDSVSFAFGYSPIYGYASIRSYDLMRTMQGAQGALVKFFYFPAPLGCPVAEIESGVTTESVCESGGHGGGGTIAFSQD